MGPWLLTGDTYDTGWKEASYCKGVEHGGTFQAYEAAWAQGKGLCGDFTVSQEATHT